MGDRTLRMAVALGRGYLRLLRATCRVRVTRPLPDPDTRGAVVWASWHNRLLVPGLAIRAKRPGVVISRSRDGELIARLVEAFGVEAVRGSSSRGGARALLEAVRHLRADRDLGVTPDGPRGPRYRVQPGVIYAARKARVPVIPIGVGVGGKLVFPSWDRFQVPLPFARVEVVCGPPLSVAPDEPIEGACGRLEAALRVVNDRAEARAGVVSP